MYIWAQKQICNQEKNYEVLTSVFFVEKCKLNNFINENLKFSMMKLFSYN